MATPVILVAHYGVRIGRDCARAANSGRDNHVSTTILTARVPQHHANRIGDFAARHTHEEQQ